MFNFGNLISGLGGAMTYQNPFDSENSYLSQIRGQVSPYYQPYINAGLGALGSLQGQYGQLMNNPGQMLNQIGQNYQASPGYGFNVNQATGAANRAAAAGGMVGSPAEQQQLAGTVSGLANQDYNQWLGQATGLYGQGLSGMQGINQMGFNASDQLSQAIMAQLMSQAKGAYAGQVDQNNMMSDLWGSIGSLF